MVVVSISIIIKSVYNFHLPCIFWDVNGNGCFCINLSFAFEYIKKDNLFSCTLEYNFSCIFQYIIFMVILLCGEIAAAIYVAVEKGTVSIKGLRFSLFTIMIIR